MHSDPILGVTLGGRYVGRQVLAEGGMATILLADDLRTSGQVAVKVLHARTRSQIEPIQRPEREGRIAGSLHHPNLCRVTDRGKLPDGSPFLIMDILSGETLADCIKREKRLPIEEAVDIVHQVLAGLDAAHAQGIVHRDVKPENAFLIPLGPRSTIVKLLDFGHAIFQNTSTFEPELTHVGIVVGTPRYMAPEQVQGIRDFDVRTDIYAAGVMLYEATTGKLPFDGKNSREVMEAIAFRSPQPARLLRPDLPPELGAVIDRAMARDRNKRYATAVEFQLALWAALKADGPRAKNPSGQTAILHGDSVLAIEQQARGSLKKETAPLPFAPAAADWDSPTRKFAPSGPGGSDPEPSLEVDVMLPAHETVQHDEAAQGEWEPPTEKLQFDSLAAAVPHGPGDRAKGEIDAHAGNDETVVHHRSSVKPE